MISKPIQIVLLGLLLLLQMQAMAQSYMNPGIPGAHADATLTRIGKDFYTTGSSSSPTPKIYHSTDLVHWEAIAQPVSATWSLYGKGKFDGCWGGHLVYYNNKCWDFFGNGGAMCFTTATQPEGAWSAPVEVKCPASVPGLGMDNSIFIDDDGVVLVGKKRTAIQLDTSTRHTYSKLKNYC